MMTFDFIMCDLSKCGLFGGCDPGGFRRNRKNRVSESVGGGEPGFLVVGPDAEDEIVREFGGHGAGLDRPAWAGDFDDAFTFFIGAIIGPGVAVGHGEAAIR